jgi:hypothetical protein
MKKTVLTCVTAALVMGLAGSGYAAEPTVDAQQAELNALKARLAVIEKQIKDQEVKQKKTDETVKKNKASELKFYGDARIRSINSGDGYSFEQRVRLNMEKQINKDAFIRVRAISMNENELGTTGTDDANNKIDNAYMQFNNLYGDKNSSLKFGRFGHSFGTTGYWSSAGSLGMYDGIEVTTGKVVKISTGFGDWGAAKDNSTTSDKNKTTLNKLEKNVFLKLGYKPNRDTTLQAWHIRETNADASPVDYEVTGLGFKTNVGKNLNLAGDYSKNVAIDGDPTGLFFTLTYGDADESTPHSYEARLYYADVDKGNVPGTLNKSINIPCNDVKGPGLSLHYVVTEGVLAEFLTGFNMEKKSTGIDNDNYYRFQVSTKF